MQDIANILKPANRLYKMAQRRVEDGDLTNHENNTVVKFMQVYKSLHNYNILYRATAMMQDPIREINNEQITKKVRLLSREVDKALQILFYELHHYHKQARDILNYKNVGIAELELPERRFY